MSCSWGIIGSRRPCGSTCGQACTTIGVVERPLLSSVRCAIRAPSIERQKVLLVSHVVFARLSAGLCRLWLWNMNGTPIDRVQTTVVVRNFVSGADYMKFFGSGHTSRRLPLPWLRSVGTDGTPLCMVPIVSFIRLSHPCPVNLLVIRFVAAPCMVCLRRVHGDASQARVRGGPDVKDARSLS